MNILMRMMKHAGLSGAVALLAACGGVGEGNTVKSMVLAFTPVDGRDQAVVSDAAVPRLRMFDCFCSNVGWWLLLQLGVK